MAVDNASRPVQAPQGTPPSHGLGLRLLVLFVGILIPLLAFGILAEDVWTHDALSWDTSILQTVHRHATATFDRVMLLITNLGLAWGVLPLDILVPVGLWFKRRRGDATFFAIAVGGAAILDEAMKRIFHRVRPDLWLSPGRPTSYSFPSGHAMGSMALVATLMVLLWPTRWRWPAIILGAFFTLAVGFSRVYLGVHYPSDVIGGWAASIAWVTGVSLLLYGHLAKPTPHTQPASEGNARTYAVDR